MTKADIVNEITKTTGIDKPAVLLVIEQFMSVVKDNEDNEYGENPVDDMRVDYDYHINTGDLPDFFDESSVDDFIANLKDWD